MRIDTRLPITHFIKRRQIIGSKLSGITWFLVHWDDVSPDVINYSVRIWSSINTCLILRLKSISWVFLYRHLMVSVRHYQIIWVWVYSLRDWVIFRKMNLLMENLSEKFCDILLRGLILSDSGAHDIVVELLQLLWSLTLFLRSHLHLVQISTHVNRASHMSLVWRSY